MLNKIYLAVIHQEGKNFGVLFPDFPGCVTSSNSLEDAISDAKVALEFHIEGMTEDGEIIPEPSELHVIREHKLAEGGVIVPVSVTTPGKTVRVNLTVKDSDLSRIDALAKENSMSRSEFMVVRSLR